MPWERCTVETEDDIASARRYYNAVVRDLNIMRETFPNVLIASALRFREGEYFSADDDERGVPGASLAPPEGRA